MYQHGGQPKSNSEPHEVEDRCLERVFCWSCRESLPDGYAPGTPTHPVERAFDATEIRSFQSNQ